MKSFNTARFGGLALVTAAIAFTAVFSYLAIYFNYPDVLDGRADAVLPLLLDMGYVGRAVWAIYSLLPLLLIPAGIGAYHAWGTEQKGTMQAAVLFAFLAAISMMLGLMRWPSVHWRLAQSFAVAGEEGREILRVLFDGLNLYLGNYIGEFLGELCLNGFFVLTAISMTRMSGFMRFVRYLILATGILGWIGMFRNVTGIVNPVSEVVNLLLPLSLFALGMVMIRRKGP